MEHVARERLLNDVEAFCRALRPYEEKCYLERRFNDRLVPLAREHDLLGMPVPTAYGGRGAGRVTFWPGPGRVRPGGGGGGAVFSGHSSGRQGAVRGWGGEAAKTVFPPASARGR